MTELLAKLTHINLTIKNRKILQDISLHLYAGKILTIIGPNGAGKSSLLKILLGLRQPDSGIVWKKPYLSIGYVPQHIHISALLPLTVNRFLDLRGGVPRFYQQQKRLVYQRHKQQLLSDLGIAQLGQQALQSLSGGEMQRVLLARALLPSPELLVLDEPAQGVDVAGQSELYQLLQQIKEQCGCGVLLVSHDLHLVMSTADQVLCLNQHICCQGQPEKVSQHPEYRKLLGHLSDSAVANLALYTHQHDHHHDVHGNVHHDKQKQKVAHQQDKPASHSPNPPSTSDVASQPSSTLPNSSPQTKQEDASDV
ncbi:MAG: ATP-binding cassette domain-containing protein [bacterium]